MPGRINFYKYIMAPVFLAVIGLVAIGIVAMFCYLIYYYVFRGAFAPTRSVTAKLVHKHVSDINFDYILVFEFNGSRQEFCVPMSVYVTAEVGDIGLLAHKGNLFKDFIVRMKATS